MNIRNFGTMQRKVACPLLRTFPRHIDSIATKNDVSKMTGGDGTVRTLVEMQGNVNGKPDVFQYIIEPNGTINHRLFMPKQ